MGAERKALVLMTADTVGGVWHYALELARGLAGSHVDVGLATMGAPLSGSQRMQVARAGNVALYESAYRLEWMAEPWEEVERAGEWLLELERALEPDLVHLNQYAFGALPFRAPKLVVAHSCVLSWWRAVHGCAAPPSWDRYRSMVQRGLAGSGLTVAPTRAMLRNLAHDYDCGTRGVVIHNGRDAASYRPARKRPVILAAGRFWDSAKNLAALEAVAPALPWPVRIAGANTHPDGGERVARGIQVLGELAPDALAQEMARAAIYAHPARYEPFGLSILEAALSGCALVLGDIPTLRELWNGAAIFVRPEDGALCDALVRVIGDSGLRERLARAARARAARYTPQRMTSGYLAAYDALAGRPQGVCVPQPSFASESRACAS